MELSPRSGLLFLTLIMLITSTSEAKTTPQKFYSELESGFNRIYVPDNSNLSNVSRMRQKLLKKRKKLPKEVSEIELADLCWRNINKDLDSSNFVMLNKDISMFRFFFPDDKRNNKLLKIQKQYYIETKNREGLEALAGSLAASKDSLRLSEEIEDILLAAKEIPLFESKIGYSGVWVSDTIDKKTGVPLYMIRVHPSGNIEFLNKSSTFKKELKGTIQDDMALKHIINPRRELQNPQNANLLFATGSKLDGDSIMKATFLSIHTSEGNAEVSKTMLGVSKNVMNTSIGILTSGGSGASIASGLGGMLFAGLMMYASTESSQSQRRDVQVALDFNLQSPEIAELRLEASEQKGSSANTGNGYKPMFEKSFTFYRISPYDRITLYDESGNPFDPYQVSILSDDIFFNPSLDPWHSKGFSAVQIVFSIIPPGHWYIPMAFAIYNHNRKKKKARQFNTSTLGTIINNAKARTELFNELKNLYEAAPQQP